MLSNQEREDYHMKYIAYGSNMVEEQMAYRCPNAKLVGTGQLPNHRLEFYLHATVCLYTHLDVYKRQSPFCTKGVTSSASRSQSSSLTFLS